MLLITPQRTLLTQSARAGQIQAGVAQTIDGQQAMRQRQVEFLEQQERMHQQGLDYFKHLSAESAFVREQMQVRVALPDDRSVQHDLMVAVLHLCTRSQISGEAQGVLLEEQKTIMQRVQNIKEFQGQLVESQQEFFEQQQKLHHSTKQVRYFSLASVL
jgi:hypothetical protein